MTFDYEELEEKLTTACEELHNKFIERFRNDMFASVGRGRLETFFDELRNEFQSAATTFIKENNLEKDAEAKKRAFTITKLYAKRCMEDFSKMDRDIAAE